MIVEPRGAFMCRSSIILGLFDPGLFHELLLTVLGPGVISTINKARGVFTCRSPTLTVLADSDPFHGLLLTVLGSRSDFHGC